MILIIKRRRMRKKKRRNFFPLFFFFHNFFMLCWLILLTKKKKKRDVSRQGKNIRGYVYTLHFSTLTMSIPTHCLVYLPLYYGPSPSSYFQHTSCLRCFDRSFLWICKYSHYRKTNCLCD